MPSNRARANALSVTVQFATQRRGVPHPSSFAKWADAAFAAGAGSRLRAPFSLTIRIVGAAESRRLNRTWRRKDKPTNVLSFPMEGVPGSWGEGRQESKDRGRPRVRRLVSEPQILGDLAICAPVVAREAREQEKQVQAHWAHMVVHGVLHLLGYDHENDREADVMEAREIRILAHFGYPNPYG